MEQQTLKQEFIDPQNTNTASPEEPVQEEQNFQVLYEESLKPLQEGEVITGTVVHIGDEFVVVDVGFKSEGQVPLREFMDSNGNLAVKIGDTVDVFVERKDDEEGIVILSKEKAVSLKVWEKIKDVYEKDSVIRGKIVEKVKGGFTVDIGIPAFLPGSQIDIKPIKDMDSLIGKEFDFKIVKYNKRRQNVVLSRRILIEAERLLEKERLLSVIKEGVFL